MVGGLVTTKQGEESLRRLAKEALVKENLPYVMGTISLLVIVLAMAVSSANAMGAETIEIACPGSVMGHSCFSWSEMSMFGAEEPQAGGDLSQDEVGPAMARFTAGSSVT